ncbi:MAG: hypothetical protein HYT37_03310, partial [Candidatus Sungbacteria bacterium]|nr:hypothetical protein [Candidatus Sungbacteria bacterium]
MKRFSHNAIIFPFIVSVAAGMMLALIVSSPLSSLASTNELSGWAWSLNIGWISFNCQDTGNCRASQYSVVAEGTGSVKTLSGYAWSPNIGWITFNSAELSGRPPVSVNTQNGVVDGWARAYSCINPGCQGSPNGWDGWIDFRGTNFAVKFNKTTCALEGWTWGGGDDSNFVGWTAISGDNFRVNLPEYLCESAIPAPAPSAQCPTGQSFGNPKSLGGATLNQGVVENFGSGDRLIIAVQGTNNGV